MGGDLERTNRADFSLGGMREKRWRKSDFVRKEQFLARTRDGDLGGVSSRVLIRSSEKLAVVHKIAARCRGVKWASAMRKATGGSAVLTKPAGCMRMRYRRKIGWAVVWQLRLRAAGGSAMRKAGMNVAALSVTPESGNFHNVMDKLKAQDAADRVASQLQVDLSLSVDVLASARSFEHVLLEEPAGRGARRPSGVVKAALLGGGRKRRRRHRPRRNVRQRARAAGGAGVGARGSRHGPGIRMIFA